MVQENVTTHLANQRKPLHSSTCSVPARVDLLTGHVDTLRSSSPWRSAKNREQLSKLPNLGVHEDESPAWKYPRVGRVLWPQRVSQRSCCKSAAKPYACMCLKERPETLHRILTGSNLDRNLPASGTVKVPQWTRERATPREVPGTTLPCS